MPNENSGNYDDLNERLKDGLLRAGRRSDGSSAVWLKTPCDFFWSPLSSLTPGNFYILGLNPGAQDGNSHREGESLPREERQTLCFENWTEHSFADKRPEFRRYWQALEDLGEVLNVDWTSRLFYGNLAFVRTVDTHELIKGLNAAGDAPRRRLADIIRDEFWEAQKVFLNEVRPRCIITIGNGRNSAYEALKEILGVDSEIEHQRFAGEQPLKAFACKPIDGKTFPQYVIGLRHFSRWPKIPRRTLGALVSDLGLVD